MGNCMSSTTDENDCVEDTHFIQHADIARFERQQYSAKKINRGKLKHVDMILG